MHASADGIAVQASRPTVASLAGLLPYCLFLSCVEESHTCVVYLNVDSKSAGSCEWEADLQSTVNLTASIAQACLDAVELVEGCPAAV